MILEFAYGENRYSVRFYRDGKPAEVKVQTKTGWVQRWDHFGEEGSPSSIILDVISEANDRREATLAFHPRFPMIY